jgi:simple sugar transport system permease protein
VAGVNPKKMIMVSMLLSGAIAGLVGMPRLLGDSHAYGRGVAEGYGFDGIAVALLGRNHPAGIVVSGLLFGFLDHSSGILQVNSIPRSIIDIIKGVIVLTVVIVNEALKRWHNRRTQAASAAMISSGDVQVAAA